MVLSVPTEAVHMANQPTHKCNQLTNQQTNQPEVPQFDGVVSASRGHARAIGVERNCAHTPRVVIIAADALLRRKIPDLCVCVCVCLFV